MASMSLSEDEQERRLCAAFWVWLYAERRRRHGDEPTDDEKRAHPAARALKALRARQDAR